MACLKPLQGFRGEMLTSTGKKKLVFPVTASGQRRAAVAGGGEVFEIPCGRCVGCRLARSQEWATRCQHEASLWERNVFVTLTYAPECLPVVGGVATLRPRDFVLFMKRLRRLKGKVRFLQAGEYGSLGRPHHHALLFNCDFPDREVLLEKGRRGAPHTLYRSRELEGLWPLGYSSLGEVTFESAAYVARYALKKVGCLPGEEVRRPGGDRVPPSADGGVGAGRVGEYMTMSLKPGIGAGWFERFHGDVFPSDEVVVRGGRVLRPPRYYGTLFERMDPEGFARVKAKRVSLPDPDSYAFVQGGKLHTRMGARLEVAVRNVRDRLKRRME